ncbi:hypothetical protein [Pseudomonas graminis]|uniref:Uncharacterized protein n=1 Tax=Pseudomonas graminis TaxID=158627 RepID=A0A1I0H9M4_9PSED|nr:hypothetical protein [Pseudomonas graminis]SET80441.1 hypothetical protein SAMN05216197_12623 [Pseudomonas graminis]
MSLQIEQHLEKIRHELQGGEQDLAHGRQRSLKYYVRDIHQQLGKWLSVQGDNEDRRRSEISWALGLIGILGVMLAITRSATSDFDWVREHTVAFRLWAVVFCTIFIGVSLERSAVIRSLWSFASTKFLVSIILSGVVLYSKGSAAAYVNGVFHVDASALPVTLVFTTGLIIIKLVLPFILTVALCLSIVHGLIGAGWIKGKLAGIEAHEPPMYSVLAFFVSTVILYFGWGWSHDQIADSRVPGKVYLIAHALDFNYAHECSNVAPSLPVIFLGAGQEAVLVAPYRLQSFDFAEFFEGSVDVPTNFLRLRCEYKSAHASAQSSLN